MLFCVALAESDLREEGTMEYTLRVAGEHTQPPSLCLGDASLEILYQDHKLATSWGYDWEPI